MDTINEGQAQDLIEEVQAVTPEQTEPVASEEPPVATATVEEEVVEPAAPPMEVEATDYSTLIDTFKDIVPVGPDAEKPEQSTASPDFSTSLGWSMDEMGVTGNAYRWIQQATDQAEEGDDERIAASMPNLMLGVPEQYRNVIELQPNFEAAERESNRLRELARRDGWRLNEGTGQMIATGIGGFVIDPFNWVPGIAMYKGLRASKVLAQAAGIGGRTNTTLARQAGIWTAFGGSEELIRGLPQLASDHTYTQEEYFLNAGMAAGMVGAMPLAGAGLRSIGSKIASDAQNSALTMGSNAVYRRMVATAEVVSEQTAQSKGILAKAKALDVAAATRESAVRAAQAIKDKVIDIPRRGFLRALSEVGDDAAKATAVTTSFFRDIGAAIEKRIVKEGEPPTPPVKMTKAEEQAARDNFNAAMENLANERGTPTKDWTPEETQAARDNFNTKMKELSENRGDPKTPEPDTVWTPEKTQAARDKFNEAIEKLASIAEKPAAKAGGKDAGAAARKPAPGQKAEDFVEGLRYQQRMTLKELNEAADAASKYLESVDVSAAARKELDYAIRMAKQQATDAIHAAGRLKGVRPERTRLNNKQGTVHVGNAVGFAAKAVSQAFRAIDSKLFPDGVNISLRGEVALSKAMAKAGIKKPDGKTWQEAWESVTSGMSHKQREIAAGKLANEMEVQLKVMADDLDAHPGMTAEMAEKAAYGFESVRIRISNAVDMVNKTASNPYMDATVTSPQWAQVSQAWRQQGNMNEIADQFVNNKLQSALKHQAAMLTNSLSSRMMASGAPLAQWFTHTILETPSGFGGQIDRNPLTAAIYSENLFNAAKIDVARGWEKLMIDTASAEGWSVGQRTRNTAGNAKTHKDVQRLSEDVMLEMNARNMGLDSTASPAVREFVDTLDGSYSKLHDLQNGHVDGIHAGNKITGYQHQVWDSHKLMSIIGTPGGRQSLTDLFTVGYVKSGFNDGEASALAKAMVESKETAAARPRKEQANFGEEQVADNMADLVSVVEKLQKDGTSADVIRGIVEKLNKLGGGETPTYAKNRTPIDLSANIQIDGKTVRVVDLMDKDVPATYIRYAKEATGRRAISEASGGLLKSDKDIHDLLTNMALEAGELGANVDVKSARIALQQIMGKSYEGQLPMNARRVRDGVSLAGMGGLGESQLAEWGLALNRGTMGLVGLAQKWGATKGAYNKKFRGIELTPEQATDTKFMSELQEVSGLYSDMYLVDRQNIHFDAAETDVNSLSKLIDTGTGGKYRPLLQRLQGRATGYGAIRQMQDQVAMASMSQDIAKFMRGQKTFSTDKRLRDIGVPLEKNSWLQKAFDEHATYKDDGTIETLNLNLWSDIDKAKYGVIMNRYASQQVQKGFVGESSPEMMNQWVAFMMQFKSYPMLAAEKQQARHLKFADKEAAVGIMLNTVSSGVARIIRYQSMAATIPDADKRKEYLSKKYEDLGADTFKYMGIAGMLPSVKDSVINMSGNGKYNYSIADEIPVLNYIDGVMRAAQDPLETSSNGIVARNTQSAAPLGTVAHMNILFRIMSEMTPQSGDVSE